MAKTLLSMPDLRDSGTVHRDGCLQLMHRACNLLVNVLRDPTFSLERRLATLVCSGIVERGAIALGLGLRLLECDAIVGRFNFEQHIALVYALIVRDRQLGDSSAHLGRHCNDIGPHGAVACPGRTHVGLPRGPGEQGRNSHRTQRDEYWSERDARLDMVAVARDVTPDVAFIALPGVL